MMIKMKIMKDHLLLHNIETTIEMLKVHNLALHNLATIMRMKMMQDHLLDAMTAMRKKSLGS